MALSRLSVGCRNERLLDEVSDSKEKQVPENQKKASIYSWMIKVKCERGIEEGSISTKETALSSVNIFIVKREEACSQ